MPLPDIPPERRGFVGTDRWQNACTDSRASTGRDRLHGQSPRARAGSCVLSRIGAGIDTEGGVSVNRRTFLTGTAASVAISRRLLLRAAASAPVMAAAGLGTPSTAEAAPLPLTPPDSVDFEDVGDSIIQASAPTIVNVRLTLGRDGVYTFEMPRLEQGTGIATALAMMIAEEAGVTLDKVRVNSADAQPNLEAGQITGGSCTLRAFDPYIKEMVLRARVAAGLPPQAGAPADPAQYQVIGKRYAKLDARDIVTGRKKFTMDQDVLG